MKKRTKELLGLGYFLLIIFVEIALSEAGAGDITMMAVAAIWFIGGIIGHKKGGWG